MGFLRCGKRVSYKTGLCRYDSFGPKRVGFGCFPTRFAQVAAAFAGSWACGRCACERGAWEEGRGGDGVGQWGRVRVFLGCGIRAGDGPAPRPCPGFPLSRERRWGGAVGRAGAGGGVPPPGALWIPAFAGTTMAGVGSSRGGGAPRRAPALGSRFRENDGGRGVRDTRELVVAEGTAPAPLDSCLCRNDASTETAPRPRPCPGFPLSRERRWGERNLRERACDAGFGGGAAARRTSGYRLSPVRRWRVWEVRETETAPRRAPALGSRESGNDGGWGAVPLAGTVSGYRTPPLWIPAFAGMTRRGAGETDAVGGGVRAAPAHLWIPAFAGTTMAGVGSTRDGDGPASPPLQSTNGHVLLVGVPAFAGTTVGGLDDGAYAAVHVYGGAGYEAGSL